MNRTSRRHRVFLLTGIISACALAAAACSSSSSPTASSSSKPGKVTLVVYSAQGYVKVMTAAFSKATGIPVKLDDNSTGPLLTQIEASKNNPKWGILWVDGATAFAGLDQQGLLYRGFEPNVNFTTIGNANIPKDKSYVPTGLTLMPGIVYNSSVLSKSQLPTSYAALLGPSWKGAVGMNDP